MFVAQARDASAPLWFMMQNICDRRVKDILRATCVAPNSNKPRASLAHEEIYNVSSPGENFHLREVINYPIFVTDLTFH